MEFFTKHEFQDMPMFLKKLYNEIRNNNIAENKKRICL